MIVLPSPAEVLGAMITPAVLISAAGTLVLSTSNRLNRVVDRVRVLAGDARRLPPCETGECAETAAQRKLIAEHLQVLAARALALRAAMTALYLAIGLLVATSIAIGVTAAIDWRHGWIPVVLGLAGTFVLLYASFLLVREARLAVGSLMQELAYARVATGEQAR